MMSHTTLLSAWPRRLGVALLALSVTASACSNTGTPAEQEPAEARLHVVATTSLLGDVVSTLVRDDGEVETLMPPGTDPHSFSPSAAQAAAIRDADLVVANGLGLEESLVDVLDAAREEGVFVLELAPKLDPIELPAGFGDAHGHGDGDTEPDGHGTEEPEADDHDEDADGGDEDHAAGEGERPLDPHVWFDPVRMAQGVRLVAEELAAADESLPDEEWLQRGADYAAELVALDEEIRAVLAEIPDERRVMVTNHDAMGYLAARYDLEIIATVIPGGSTLGSASARRIAELAELVRDADVPAVFAENVSDRRVAEALAREVGHDVAVVSLYTDSLGEEGSGADSYTGLLRTDARLIADALTP